MVLNNQLDISPLNSPIGSRVCAAMKLGSILTVSKTIAIYNNNSFLTILSSSND